MTKSRPVSVLPWWWVVDGDSTDGHMIEPSRLDPKMTFQLLTDLRAAVPRKTIYDGGREYERYLSPDEVDEPHLKAAAMELMLGELEMIAAGQSDPDSERVLWKNLLFEVEQVLDAVAELPDDRNDGIVALAEFVAEARDNLDAIQFATAFAKREAKSDHERDFILSVQAETALHAFGLGWRMRAVDQKPFDQVARTGQKVQEGARLGGEMARSPKPKTVKILSEMDKTLDVQRWRGTGRSVRAAGISVFRKGFGTSAEANAKLYYRHRRK